MFPFRFLSDFSGVSSLVLRRICYTLLRRIRRLDVFKADLVTVIDAVKHDIVSMHDIVSRFSDVQDNFFAAAVMIRQNRYRHRIRFNLFDPQKQRTALPDILVPVPAVGLIEGVALYDKEFRVKGTVAEFLPRDAVTAVGSMHPEQQTVILYPVSFQRASSFSSHFFFLVSKSLRIL